jgi:hypothetical protein
MMNLIIRCIETFPIKEFLFFNNFKCHDFHHFNYFIYITLKYLSFQMEFLTNHMFSDV